MSMRRQGSDAKLWPVLVTCVSRMAGLCAERGPLFKVILLGEAGVGKTALFHRLKDDTFFPNRSTTMGIDSCSKYVKVGDTQVTLSVWDTAGVERFRTLTNNYYRGAHVAILVYSVDDIDSLNSLGYWVRDADEYSPDATKVVIGNKADLHHEVSIETEQGFTDNSDCKSFMRVSAKTGKGVNEVFQEIAQMLVAAGDSQMQSLGQSGNVMLQNSEETAQKKGCCS